MNENQKIGKMGEEFAAGVLTAKGFELLGRNYTCPYGEIDLIVRRNRVISFIEVKTRTGDLCGEPAEAVTIEKQRHIKNAARHYLASCRWLFTEIEFKIMEIKVEEIGMLE